MTFAPFPTNLQQAVQQNYLNRAFEDRLMNNFAYRLCADPFTFQGRIGTTITYTRPGLIQPNLIPLNPATNTGFDNGLVAQEYSLEQFTLQLIQVPNRTIDINLLDDETTIARFAMLNAENLAVAQAASIDYQARKALFDAYMGGNTFLHTAFTSGDTILPVNDIRGFDKVVVNGEYVPVSVTNPLPILINGTIPGNVTGVVADVVNASLAAVAGGISGTLTVQAIATNIPAGASISSIYAPIIIRPNGKTSTAALTASDTFNVAMTRSAVADKRNNAVPTNRDGYYHIYCDATSMNQLQGDDEFRFLVRGRGTDDKNVSSAWTDEILQTKFIQTTQAPVQLPGTIGSVTIPVAVHRPAMCGAGALIEGIFDQGMDAIKNFGDKIGNITVPISIPNDFDAMNNTIGNMRALKNMYLYLRPPLDRLGQTIGMSSNYVGGFTAPTDVTATSATIPTASNSYYKRATIFETA